VKNKAHFTKKQRLTAALILFLFASLTLFLFLYRQDEKRFTNITSQLFTTEMEANTLNMHYTLARPSDFGIYDYKAVLPVYNAESALAGHAATENALASLRLIHTGKLNDSDAYLHTLLTRYLENAMTLSEYPYYTEPLSPSSGMQSQLPILLAEYAFRSKRDVEDYLALLDQTDEYFASMLCYEQEKLKAGLIMPASSLKSVEKQCDTIISASALESGAHFLQTTFRERVEKLYQSRLISYEEMSLYLAKNEQLLKTVMLPAYESLKEGLRLLEDKSVPLTGLAAKPQGKAFYEALLISETGSYRPVSEIQDMLIAQFDMEYEEIHDLVYSYPEAAQSYLNSADAAFPLTTPGQMLADLQERMKELFPAIPEGSTHIAVKAVSESLQDYAAPAFYLTAPLDDTDNNVIYINKDKTPDGLDLYTTLAHEGYPGHLYQTVYSNRKAMEQDKRPVRELLWYGGYLEGWALYVEFLSYDYASALLQEAGLEQEAQVIQIERHNRNLQLCLYSMLDTMIHYENASYSQVAKMLEGFGITDSNSIRAVYTYIAQEPCNYLKYYLGYLEILSLKEKAAEHWGAAYSPYRFHSFFLDNGPADFKSLEERLMQTTP